MKSEQPGVLRARIGRIVDEAKVAYVVAHPETEEEAKKFGLVIRDSVTFTRTLLPASVKLAEGQIVILDGIFLHANGWRATTVSLVQALALATGEVESCVAPLQNA